MSSGAQASFSVDSLKVRESPVRILALETSGRVGSVAVGLGPQLLAVRHFSHGMRHAVALMPMVQELVAAQGWRPGDIQQVYLSTGPGSFTGLRIAIAVARTLHQALGCQLVAVPTLDVLACNAPPEVQNLVVVLDAKRGQVFATRYQRLTAGQTAGVHDEAQVPCLVGVGGPPLGMSNPESTLPLVRMTDPALVDPAAFIRATPRPVTILGEGVDYHRPALQAGVDDPAELIELDKKYWPGSAAAVHALGYQRALRKQWADPATLLPVYIRLPEAQELWEKRHPTAAPQP
ncbi:MAG: tRNA (adenosine(37)-N6)-threonylcarbamoyltransferase complex dimerization subunit type 1 TsaB [Phycisphaerae bacterium]